MVRVKTFSYVGYVSLDRRYGIVSCSRFTGTQFGLKLGKSENSIGNIPYSGVEFGGLTFEKNGERKSVISLDYHSRHFFLTFFTPPSSNCVQRPLENSVAWRVWMSPGTEVPT